MTAWSMIACGFACGVAVAAPACGGPTWVRTPAEARHAYGQRVRIEGTAVDAKLGPVIASGGLVVYVGETPRWPADALGRHVVAEGTLEETRESVTIGGVGGAERSAGLETPALILRGATYQVVPETK